MPVITFLGSEKTLLLLTGRHPLGIGSAPSKRSRNKWPPREANYRKQMSKKWSLSLHAKTSLLLLPFSPFSSISIFSYFHSNPLPPFIFLLYPPQVLSCPPHQPRRLITPEVKASSCSVALGVFHIRTAYAPSDDGTRSSAFSNYLNRSQNSIYNVLIMEYKSSSRLRPISYNLLTPFVRFMPFVLETPTAS